MTATLNGSGVVYGDGTVAYSTGFNGVGSYCQCYVSGGNLTSGAGYAAGGGTGQVQSYRTGPCGVTGVNNLSGSWRFMGGTGSNFNGYWGGVLFVRYA